MKNLTIRHTFFIIILEEVIITDKEKLKESNRKAVQKYQSKFERINCRLPLGTRERIEKTGYQSANSFIISAIMEKLEKEENYLKKA